MAETRKEASTSNGYPAGTPEWLKFILVCLRQFGLATLIVVVGGYWLCTRIAEPLMATYTENIRVQSKVSVDQAEAIKDISRTLEERQDFSNRTEKTMTAFADNSLKNQSQLLLDHQRIMAELDKKKP